MMSAHVEVEPINFDKSTSLSAEILGVSDEARRRAAASCAQPCADQISALPDRKKIVRAQLVAFSAPSLAT